MPEEKKQKNKETQGLKDNVKGQNGRRRGNVCSSVRSKRIGTCIEEGIEREKKRRNCKGGTKIR